MKSKILQNFLFLVIATVLCHGNLKAMELPEPEMETQVVSPDLLQELPVELKVYLLSYLVEDNLGKTLKNIANLSRTNSHFHDLIEHYKTNIGKFIRAKFGKPAINQFLLHFVNQAEVLNQWDIISAHDLTTGDYSILRGVLSYYNGFNDPAVIKMLFGTLLKDKINESIVGLGNDKIPPLFFAIKTGNIALAKLLLTLGADPLAVNEQGQNALDFASTLDSRGHFLEFFNEAIKKREQK